MCLRSVLLRALRLYSFGSDSKHLAWQVRLWCGLLRSASNAPRPAHNNPAGPAKRRLTALSPTRGSTRAEKEWSVPLDWMLYRSYSDWCE
jgi:hypothetical protein